MAAVAGVGVARDRAWEAGIASPPIALFRLFNLDITRMTQIHPQDLLNLTDSMPSTSQATSRTARLAGT